MFHLTLKVYKKCYCHNKCVKQQQQQHGAEWMRDWWTIGLN